jgi:hypothetical protein
VHKINFDDKPKFYIGQKFERDGVIYRVRAGNRCEGDMVLEFYLVRSGWHRPTIAHTCILADFKSQVEENNYGQNGRVKKGLGALFLQKRIEEAFTGGWLVAANRTAQEVRVKQEERERIESLVSGQLGLPI